jgi:hypothetical protein
MFSAIKKPASLKGNRLFPKITLWKRAASSATRLSFLILWTRGFVPPGFPEFTFSETSNDYYFLIIFFNKKNVKSIFQVLTRYIFNGAGGGS